jgi:TRAP-type C4-dicarboxylate transport system permease small subunit
VKLVRLPLQVASVACLAALVLLPSLQIVLRDLFVAPIVGLEEVARMALILLVFLAYPLVVDKGEDIVMAEAKGMLPRRARRAADLVIGIACTVAAFIMAWAVWEALAANPRNETPTLRIPFWIFLASAFIGFAGAGLLHLYRLFRPRPENPTLV